MPFYEYECPNCGYHDEVLQKINDKPLKKCPSCGKNGLKKLMSAPVFRLKGSGWYETDFKSDKENKRNLAGADKEEAKTEAKADAKPDAKADAKPEGDKARRPRRKRRRRRSPRAAKPAPVKTAASKSRVQDQSEAARAKRPARR